MHRARGPVHPGERHALSPPRALAPPPRALAATRAALHRLAERVLSPTQAAVNGDIHFEWTPGGFATPPFDGRVLRVEGATLADGERRAPITTLRAAAELVGAPPADHDDAPLEVDDAAARWLGDFYGFATGVLRELDADAPIRLWPEHFDVANELGDEAAGTRATYGASPGDEQHADPYLYVAPWSPQEGELWNATGFSGAELALADLLAARDQHATALRFFAERQL